MMELIFGLLKEKCEILILPFTFKVNYFWKIYVTRYWKLR